VQVHEMLQAEISAVLKRAIQMHQTGAVTQAERIYREILATDRNVADAWNMLAVALCQQRRIDEAMQAAKRATGLRPNIAPYWLTRGNIAVKQGNDSDAQSSFRRAIKLDANFAEAHYWLARSYHRQGRLAQAIESYRSALGVASESPEICYHLARALLFSDRQQEALQAYQRAFAGDPDDVFDRRECFDHFRYLEFESSADFWHSELIRFFRRNDVDKSRYAIAGLRVLMGNPAFRAARAAAEAGDEFKPDADALKEVMHDELFGLLLRDTLIAQPEFEVLLTRLRAKLLLDAELRARAPLDFLCDLALQCFNNEFIFQETHAESGAVAELTAQIETALHADRAVDESLMRLVATVAMYRPLFEISGIEMFLTREVLHNAVDRLLHCTVANVAEERKLRSGIGVIGSIADKISQAVRAQYEENPYPCWLSFDRMPPVSAAEWIQREVPGLQTSGEFPATARILVAGCGTGVETLGLATQIMGSQVTAIDLSLSSLAYGQRMANQLGVANVEFRQADILKLTELPERFDIVYCVGVLMTISDPEAGLRALLPIMRPGGLLKLGLYSKRARGAVNIAREIIRQRQLPATPSAMREFRQTVFAAERNSPLKSLLRWRDFYSMSDCRDFLFHVKEHQFDLPEVAAMLTENGLKVLGMSKQLPRSALLAYHKIFPRDKTMADLQNWHVVEKHYPETFLGMYQIWCCKPREGRT
jgi:2-polyprenyl-3-methyl-5-hydroxy-6-metoxy-1,4-benzoquinol methylase/cytochrome c-type biogenesis protein CcmH/NrfG